MKAMLDPLLPHLDTLLRLIAVMQIALAILSLYLPRILDWKTDIGRMPLLMREVFEIHSWFISITLVIWAVLTWRFAPEMAFTTNELARWLCAAIGFFWGIRCVLQWTHYSASHWRGKPGRTVIHWLLTLGYGGWAAVYLFTAFRK